MNQQQSYWAFLINLIGFFGTDHILEHRFPARAGKQLPFSIPSWPGVMVSVLTTLCGGSYRPFTTYWFPIPPLWRLISGTFLGLASIIALWSRWILGPQYGREKEEQPPDTLIQTGPYRVVRHPMYAAYVTQTISQFLLTGNPLWFTSIPTAISFLRRTYHSDHHLAEAFGPLHQAYRQRVPDLLHPGDRLYNHIILRNGQKSRD